MVGNKNNNNKELNKIYSQYFFKTFSNFFTKKRTMEVFKTTMAERYK